MEKKSNTHPALHLRTHLKSGGNKMKKGCDICIANCQDDYQCGKTYIRYDSTTGKPFKTGLFDCLAGCDNCPTERLAAISCG